MEGYLLKWTNYIFGWQRRYFILYSGVLHYCKEKGSAQRGTIHLDISSIVKHPTNSKKFSISSGCTSIYLKAYTADESTEWFRALKQAQLDLKCAKPQMDADTVSSVIMDKVSAMWGVHSQLIAAIDQIPLHLQKSNKNLENIVGLLEEMKKTSAKALGIVEHELDNALRTPRNLNRFSCEGVPYEDEFEDAVSQEENVPERRCLPVLRMPKHKKSFWDSMQGTIGLDYLKIKTPLSLYEPLTLLQRLAEDLTHSYLLQEANICSDPSKRLALVASFAASASLQGFRPTRPFNSFVGETFELQTQRIKMVAEQVSKNVSALHCEHSSFKYWNSTEVESEFIEDHLQVLPVGDCYVELLKYGERYSWGRPRVLVKGIITGKTSVLRQGEVQVSVANSQANAVLEFSGDGVRGRVFGEDRREVWGITGDLNRGIEISGAEGKEVTMKALQLPDGHEHCYSFSWFALQLNLPAFVLSGLPETDSRFRKDVRALENGEIKLAAIEYEKNVNKAKNCKDTQGPKWFRLDSSGWEYSGDYWEHRSN